MPRSHDPAADSSEAPSEPASTTSSASTPSSGSAASSTSGASGASGMSGTAAAASAAAPAPVPAPDATPDAPAAAEKKDHPTASGKPAPEPAAPEPEAAAEAARAPEPEAAPAAVAVAVADGPGAAGAAAAGAPPGRPRGSLLAAAGIAGTLLISVPLLVMAMNDDNSPSDRVRTETVGGATLDPGLAGEPGAAYRAESASPSASATDSTKHKPGDKADGKGGDKVAGDGSAAGGSGAGDAQGSGSSGNSGKEGEQGTAQKHTTKKSTKKKSSRPSARSLANAASSQSRVLLKNVSTGQCADVPNFGNGRVDGPVNQYPCNGTSGDNQLWNLVPHSEVGKGPGGSVLFVIRNNKDGFCLDLPNFGAVSGGTRITEYHCRPHRNDNQLYWLDRRSDGTYWIRNLASRNLCLNVAGAATGRNDAALQVGTCNDSSNDDTHWYFTRG
ncbi:RICIN domain-containing protein [Streptomyces griseoaurantiacus]|uniref:RICIN domain-containing protein n=2 Tax=Streptomyces TaxID=1883 RepID=UPI0036E78CBA